MNCPVCDYSDKWPLRWTPDLALQRWRAEHGDVDDYSWFLCKCCANGFPSRQPSKELLAFYWNRDRQDDLEENIDDAIWMDRSAAARRNAERVYNLFAPLLARTPGRMLDIACGLGEAVRYFSEKGWDAAGIDVDPALRRFHEKIGIKTTIAPIETASLEGKFDTILVSHAIYFIPDPRQFLERLRRSLTSEGRLLIVLSNFLAPEHAAGPSYPHSFLPVASSMAYALALSGYKTLFVRRRGGSVYLAASVGQADTPAITPWLIYVGHQTRAIRYVLFGRPKLILYAIAKMLLRRTVGFARARHSTPTPQHDQNTSGV